MFYDEKVDYISLLPERLGEVMEFSIIAEAVEEQFDAINGKIKRMAEGKTISCADSEMIQRWEKMLGVSAPMDNTLQARREALTAKLMTKPPINLRVLKEIIETYMGVPVDISVFGQTVTVKYRGESRISDLSPLYATIYDAIPANMLLYIIYSYMNWDELDGFKMNFDMLDDKGVDWEKFDKGEWI